MALKVQYTATFEYTFKVLVEFLQDKWGENMYKASSFDTEVRVAPIKKLSSLFYAVGDGRITLLYIVDSRQEPFWL